MSLQFYKNPLFKMLVMFHYVNQKESNPYSYTFLSTTNLYYLRTKTTKPNAISNVRTEIVLIPKLGWAQTLTAQTINLQSIGRRTRFISEEKRLNLTIQDDMAQTRLSNLSSESTMLFWFIWFSSRSKLYQSSKKNPMLFSVHSSRLYTAIFVLSLPHTCMLD